MQPDVIDAVGNAAVVPVGNMCFPKRPRDADIYSGIVLWRGSVGLVQAPSLVNGIAVALHVPNPLVSDGLVNHFMGSQPSQSLSDRSA